MKTAIRLITIADIPIRLHWSFIFLMGWIGYMAFLEEMSVYQTFFFYLLILGLFICVIAHEYGHALIARRYGISTHDIYILPIGGLARLASLPDDPKKEMIIAIAGPLVNLGIAIVLTIVIWGIDGLQSLSSFISIQDLLHPVGLLYAMTFLNIMLFFFNLIPAYPMDGGRILRSVLSLKLGKRSATIFASYFAQVIAIAFFIFGMDGGHFTIVLIGMFIFFTSRSERRNVEKPITEVLEEE